MLPILPVGVGLNPVQPAPIALDPTVAAGASAPTTGPGATFQSFSDMLGQAIDAVNGTQATADAAATDLVTGKSTDIHTVMIDMQEAKTTFDMAVQVRNKLLDGYNSLMQTQV